ncbi:hypothetical protein PF003_g1418 [Phytophthora fragariae]|nr:hypothetical protein PF003_g1418 [Phytophthora fragariae]
MEVTYSVRCSFCSTFSTSPSSPASSASFYCFTGFCFSKSGMPPPMMATLESCAACTSPIFLPIVSVSPDLACRPCPPWSPHHRIPPHPMYRRSHPRQR